MTQWGRFLSRSVRRQSGVMFRWWREVKLDHLFLCVCVGRGRRTGTVISTGKERRGDIFVGFLGMKGSSPPRPTLPPAVPEKTGKNCMEVLQEWYEWGHHIFKSVVHLGLQACDVQGLCEWRHVRFVPAYTRLHTNSEGASVRWDFLAVLTRKYWHFI